MDTSAWQVVTFRTPITFSRSDRETWLLNPVRRYVFHNEHVRRIEEHVATCSTLAGSAHYRPLQAGSLVAGKRVLVERFRDRGIGDLLFLTGPFAFLRHVTGENVRIHVYAYTDRGAVLQGSPQLEHRSVYVGPTHYDDFQHYDYQWMVGSVSESNQEADQLNVYDALYRELGYDPAQVDPKFKRPCMTIDADDLNAVYAFWRTVWENRLFDLRKTGYYVLAPLTHSALRVAPYQTWLDIAAELSQRRPVIMVGRVHEAVPGADMPVGEFITRAQELGNNVISLMHEQISLRFVSALMSKATAAVSLDTGRLYIAQACRVPAISLWGPHDPGVRIGYDPDYMDLAIWNQKFCDNAPCFAYKNFPQDKCPEGPAQRICQVLRTASVSDVLSKLSMIESRRIKNLGVFKSATGAKA